MMSKHAQDRQYPPLSYQPNTRCRRCGAPWFYTLPDKAKRCTVCALKVLATRRRRAA